MAVKTRKTDARLYEVTCFGEYYGLKNGQKFRGAYEITRKLGEESRKAGFLSVFRNHILDANNQKNLAKLREEYPYWLRYRTHDIKTAVEISDKMKPLTDLGLLNRSQLVKFIDQKGYEIDAELYESAPDLRQALKDYKDNREAFLKAQAKRRTMYGTSIAIAREVAQLNDLGYENAPTGTSDPSQYPEDQSDPTTSNDAIQIKEIDELEELEAVLKGV